jgi:ferredoxin, 2Fe-2S
MVKVTYIAFDGTKYNVDAPAGWSLMEGAKKNDVPGIDADCGGGCSCGTCHVYIEPEWQALVGPQNPIETATLEFAEDVKDNSRLSCQVKLSEALDGLTVRMPESQK